MQVRPAHSGRRHLQQHLALAGLWVGELLDLHPLRPGVHERFHRTPILVHGAEPTHPAEPFPTVLSEGGPDRSMPPGMIAACLPLAAFHPAVRRWFASRLGEPTPPQREGWPLIREGRHTLIAAPTGLGQDAGRLPLGDRLAAAARGRSCPTRRRSSTSRRCARSRTTSRRTCQGRWPRSAPRPVPARGARAGPHGRHAVGAARRDDAPAAAHPGHDARVALPPAHERERPRACWPTCAP